MEKQTLRQHLADYHGVGGEDVTQEMFDVGLSFLRERHQGPSEAGIWVLDEEEQANLTEYLDKRSSGELVEEGEVESDPWDEFISWARRFYEAPEFDANERDYKLEIAKNINEARGAIAVEAEDWQQKLKRSFSSPNNLTHYITHSRFMDWVAEEPAKARQALVNLWDDKADLEQRLDDFITQLPKAISSPGARVQIASFLLLAYPTKYAMYRPSPINKAVELTEFPEIPSRPESDRYLKALDFFDRFIQEALARGVELRDRLDAQGIVWALTKADPPIEWPEEDKETFLRYRGDRPMVWWVNQGLTYGQESGEGIVKAPTENRAGVTLQHHKNVSLLRKKDLIVHYADGHVRAMSVVSDRAQVVAGAEDDGRDRWIAKTDYHELTNPIEVREMDPTVRSPDAGPFDKYGGVKQVYLVPTSVEFSDWIQEAYRDRWPEDSPWAPRQRNTWLFQSNPTIWDLIKRLSEMDEGEEDDFLINRYKTEYSMGDRVLLWSSGASAGLYAIGQISGELFERAQDEEHYSDSDEELAVPWMLTEKLDPPVPRSALLEHPVLKGFSVITAPQASNFRVTDEQWQELRALIDSKPSAAHEPVERSLSEIGAFIANQGLIISDRTLRRFHVSIRTRGFVVLSGISGTGKTWLTEAYAEAVGARYLLVPVAPNWTTNEDLLGYLNPLDNTYHHTAFSEFLKESAGEYTQATEAQREPRPFILALDEMNLARVEYYFAKFLSAMEIRSRRGVADIELAPDHSVQLTPNLLFVGTVNVDETTHGFADKVFDRAQLIDMEAPREAIADHIGSAAFRESLLDIYDAVEPAKPFAFRVVDDIKAYVGESDSLDVEWRDAVDEQILQKVLPKLSGADPAIKFALDRLIELCEDHEFGLTKSKAQRMADDFARDGFTSYF